MAVEGLYAIITHLKKDPNDCKQEVWLACEMNSQRPLPLSGERSPLC